MPHINLPELPGILAPMAFRPEAAKALNQLAQTLLRGESTLSIAERELIATYVSRKNNCQFCTQSHKAVTEEFWGSGKEKLTDIIENPESSNLSGKLKALLVIAAAVQQSGQHVETKHIEQAKLSGASDIEIHDTVLIAAAFCMFNRYVDGLATLAPPTGSSVYKEIGVMLKDRGYEGVISN